MFRIAYIVFIFFLIISCDAQTRTFSIQNSLPIKRNDELIVLKKTIIEKYVGKIADDFQYVISFNKKEIYLQTVDVNNDSVWDEIVFLSSFKPNEKKTFAITKIINQKFIKEDTTQPLAHVRMKPKNADDTFGESITSATMPYQNAPNDFSKKPLPPYLTEGPAWENDKVAFRLYFDTRNTIDIYGKRITGMVMDTVGDNTKSSYHNLAAWGMDILHVVKSLGAGSLGIETTDENGKDTLIRLGGENIIKETYQELANGPLFAAFEMNYIWKINNEPVTIKQQISIWCGQYFYNSKVTIEGAPPNAKLLTGIADFYENSVDSFRDDKAAVLLSYGKQSENKDELGLAVMLPQSSFVNFSEAKKINSDVTETHLIAQQIKNSQPIYYRFYSCWEKTDSKFASSQNFKNYMKEEAQKFSYPLQINWQKQN